MGAKNNITVAVGMSGGVDSTVAAYILKKHGYRVIGLTMKLWDSSFRFAPGLKAGCFGPDEKGDLKDARAAAKRIGIPHYTVDLSKEYKKEIIEYFRKEYLEGRTPNPCVRCNQRMKFGFMIEKAAKSGIKFDRFATGHYAAVARDEKSGRYLLKKGVDEKKDQSYFLARLKQRQLEKIIFPLGGYRKLEIKKLAAEAGFANYAEKPESQDFIGGQGYDVLFKKSEITPGNIVGLSGEVLGRHRGIIYYTVGQRRGLDIGGTKEPLFVVRIDAGTNSVVAGPKSAVFSGGLSASGLNWIAFKKPPSTFEASAKIRQQGREFPCRVTVRGGGSAVVRFKEPQPAVTPGQTVVFYRNDIVLGSGVIEKSLR